MRNALQYVCVGDTVEVSFPHETPPRTFKMKVEVVERRYGNNRNGTRINPLVAGTVEGETRTEICDLSFVTRVISRAKLEAPKRNVFRDAVQDGYKVGRSGKCWVGSLLNVTSHALSELDLELDRYIHEERLRELYDKSCHAGFTGHISLYIMVNPKVFGKWVAKNWHRILMTSSEMHEYANKKFEEERAQLDFEISMWDLWDNKTKDDIDDFHTEVESVRH